MSEMGSVIEITITSASTRIMNVECSACHLDADFLSQGSGTPILYLTRCGHICCDVCRTNWFASDRETCPKCRQPQTRSNLIRIYYDIAQSTQPSTPPITVAIPQQPGNGLQVSSERFLVVVADQATDIFEACVTLAPLTLPYHSRFDFLMDTGHEIFYRGRSSRPYQAISL